MDGAISAAVQVNYHDYRGFVLYNAYMRGKNVKVSLVALYALILLLTIFIIALEVCYGFDLFLTILIVFELLLPVYRYMAIKRKIDKSYEKIRKKGITNSYTFSEDRLHVDTAGEEISGSTDMRTRRCSFRRRTSLTGGLGDWLICCKKRQAISISPLDEGCEL